MEYFSGVISANFAIVFRLLTMLLSLFIFKGQFFTSADNIYQIFVNRRILFNFIYIGQNQVIF